MKKKRSSIEDVERFMSTLYPDAANLAIACFDEKKVLNDAADEILLLRMERSRYRKALEFVASAWDGNRSAIDNANWMYDSHCVAAEALRGEK